MVVRFQRIAIIQTPDSPPTKLIHPVVILLSTSFSHVGRFSAVQTGLHHRLVASRLAHRAEASLLGLFHLRRFYAHQYLRFYTDANRSFAESQERRGIQRDILYTGFVDRVINKADLLDNESRGS